MNRSFDEIIRKVLTEGLTPAKRPADQDNADTQTPTGVADPAGGAGGQGAPANRPADNISQADPAPAPVGMEEVQPANQTPDPSAVGKKTPGKGATEMEPGKGLGEAFAEHLNKDLTEFKIDLGEKAKPVLESLQLDEEFAKQAGAFISTTINEAAKQHLTAINAKAGALFEHLMVEHTKLMEEKADKHMENVISEWVQENKLAIESGIRVQITESFMDKLKGLLESHYVELPAGKKDLYEAAIQKGDEILEQYNAEREKSVGLSEEVTVLKKQLAISNATRGLVATKAEKVRSLAEGYDFDAQFDTKLSSLVEEVNKTAAAPAAGKNVTTDPLNESADAPAKPAAKPVSKDPLVSAAASFLKRQ